MASVISSTWLDRFGTWHGSSFPLNVGLLVRPASLSLRLAGNMTGDHMVFGIMSDLTVAVLPAIFLGLGIFVSFLQAFVFTLLSAIYISLSVADHGHEAH